MAGREESQTERLWQQRMGADGRHYRAVLRLEKGTLNCGMETVPGTKKGEEMYSPLEFPEGIQPCQPF